MNPEDVEQSSGFFQAINLPQHWPVQTDLLQWAANMRPGEATILVIGGMVYLLFGWYIFRILVTLNAALVGAYVGAKIGQAAGSMGAGICVGGFIAGAAAWPLIKYAVSFMGGIFGALLGASIWRAVNLDISFIWAGALMGLIFFGLLSFIIFRTSVMMYTSLQGSVMLIFGILGLIYKYQEIAPKITDNMTAAPFILPMSIFIPAVLGWIYQQTQFGGQPEPAGKKK
jgi:hypothetical protein